LKLRVGHRGGGPHWSSSKCAACEIGASPLHASATARGARPRPPPPRPCGNSAAPPPPPPPSQWHGGCAAARSVAAAAAAHCSGRGGWPPLPQPTQRATRSGGGQGKRRATRLVKPLGCGTPASRVRVWWREGAHGSAYVQSVGTHGFRTAVEPTIREPCPTGEEAQREAPGELELAGREQWPSTMAWERR
jgi:hypothetical protein